VVTTLVPSRSNEHYDATVAFAASSTSLKPW
jgi:hypothetical protein